MTQDEIIEMARHADREWDCDRDMFEWLETFAKQVAEREREACAKVCEDYGRSEEMQAIGNDFAEAIRARGQE